MDVNNTHFHLLYSRSDWEPLIPPPGDDRPTLWWDDERGALSLYPRLFRFPTSPLDQAVQPEQRRGAARDQFGNWYWLAENQQQIYVSSANGRSPAPFWPPAPDLAPDPDAATGGNFRPLTPTTITAVSLRGLTVTNQHYLVVGVLDPAGLLIFDLHAGGPPLQLLWPPSIPFAPLEMASTPDGGLWIIDEAPRAWRLNRHFRVLTPETPAPPAEPPPPFTPLEPPPNPPEHLLPAAITLEMALPLPHVQRPLALAPLPDDSLLVLDLDPAAADSAIYRYHCGELLGVTRLGAALDRFLADQAAPPPAALRGHALAFIPDKTPPPRQISGLLYLVTAEGNQAFTLRLWADAASFTLDLLPRYLPIRLYGGRGLVAAGEMAYYDDTQARWLPLAEQPRPRFTTRGVLETAVFDGKEPDCVWHRLFVDGRIPPDAQLLVESRAANEESLLPQQPWQAEPPLYRRHAAELPYYRPFPEAEARLDGVGVWELLLQRANGRYAQLRLTLLGSGRNTPRLRALRLYYPRFSYLTNYLPAVYRQDALSASFLDRFLANVEGSYTALEGRIAAAQVLFDVDTTPAEYLDWLAGWFGALLEPEWDENRRRLFLRHAMTLFRQRGTPAGLLRALRLALDPCPDDSLFTEDVLAPPPHILRQQIRLVEQFLTRRWPGVLYGDPTDLEEPGITAVTPTWTPAQGAAPLHQRYRAFLEARYQTIDQLNATWGSDHAAFAAIQLPPTLPEKTAVAQDWQTFLHGGLGFTYAPVTPADKAAYQAFLARRYRRIERLNTAYQRIGSQAYASFAHIPLPAANDFPASGTRLFDWIQFVSLALPIQRHAHRFTVLVPTASERSLEEMERRLARVARIVEREKPAHTRFEVKPYWALFRVGEARLGLDSVLDRGSRFIALLLGQGYLASGYLAAEHPWNVADRLIAGRDRPGGQLL